jgi:hypothetical protein
VKFFIDFATKPKKITYRKKIEKSDKPVHLDSRASVVRKNLEYRKTNIIFSTEPKR